MSNKETKLRFIDALYNRGEYIKTVNSNQFVIRCPFCGDSSNPNKGHLYVHVNANDNYPMLYHCFKCTEGGVVDAELIRMLEIDDVDLKTSIKTLNKTSDNAKGVQFVDGEKLITFDFSIPKTINRNKIKYIESRLGKQLTDEDIHRMKIVTSLRDFLMENNIKTTSFNSYSCKKIEDHYVGFLSFGSSYILFRDISGKEKIPWVKYPIVEKSNNTRAFYSMDTSIDVMTTDKITINLTEGVMDILSVYKNLGYDKENTLNIAVCGKHYQSLLAILTDMGFVGSNITLNIFSDNDAMFNKNKNNKPTTINWYRNTLKGYRHLYGSVNVYYNTIGKDVGVSVDKISLKKYKL